MASKEDRQQANKIVKQDAQEFLREREKFKSKLMNQGLSEKAAQEAYEKQYIPFEERDPLEVKARQQEEARNIVAASEEKQVAEKTATTLPIEQALPLVQEQIQNTPQDKGILAKLGITQPLIQPPGGEQVVSNVVPIPITGVGAAAANIPKGLSLAVTEETIAKESARKVINKGLTTKASGFLSKAATWAAGLYGIKSFLGIPENRIRDADSEMSQMREDLTSYVAGVRNGALTTSEALDSLEEMNEAIIVYEETIKREEARNYPNKLFGGGKAGAALIRARKIKNFIRNAKQDVALAQVTGEVDEESLALLYQQLQNI